VSEYIGTPEAIKIVYGVEDPAALPVTTTVHDFMESGKELRLELSKRFPSLDNGTTDRIVETAIAILWPGVTTWAKDLIYPNEAADPRVREIARRKRQE
jgi:hypothetical protein